MNKKILIIGYGEIAQRHYKNLKSLLPKSNFAVLTKKKKNNQGKLIFLNSLSQAIKFNPNITLICSPAPTHIKYAEIFSKLNSNIFIEKPVALNLVEFKKFLKGIKNKKITILSGYNLRFDKSLAFLRKCMTKKILGNILSVRSEVGQYLPSWRKKNYKKTVSANKQLGGGVINELSHDIDILIMLFKKIEFISGINYKISDLKINTEDTAHAIFKSKFQNRSFYISLNMDFYRHDTTRSCVVIGSKATLKWDGIKKQVMIFKKGKKIPTIYNLENNKNQSYISEIKYFIENINKKNNLLKTFEDNLQLIKILKLIKKNKCFV